MAERFIRLIDASGDPLIVAVPHIRYVGTHYSVARGRLAAISLTGREEDEIVVRHTPEVIETLLIDACDEFHQAASDEQGYPDCVRCGQPDAHHYAIPVEASRGNG